MKSIEINAVRWYGLRIRFTDAETWGKWTWYETKKARDDDERINRCLGGIRTNTTSQKFAVNVNPNELVAVSVSEWGAD